MEQNSELNGTVAGAQTPADEEAAATAASDAFEAIPPFAKPKKHKARIEHKTPGRLRMKVPAAKGDPAALEAYRAAFAMIPGVVKVKAKPETGSIVIHYDADQEQHFDHHFHHCCGHHLDEVSRAEPPDDEVSELAKKIEREADFLAERSEFAKVTVDFYKSFDQELKLATDNTLDLKIVLAGGLAAFTFLEIGAEAATPMWVTLALFSLNHFAELQHQQPAPAAAPAARTA